MSTTMKPTESGTAFLTTPVSESADKIFTLEQRRGVRRRGIGLTDQFPGWV